MKIGANQTGECGFTLVEVMIALVIFSIGILGILGMQISSIQGNDTAFEYSHALDLAQSQLDNLMALPYNATALNDSDGDGTNKDSNNDGNDNSGNNFGLDDKTAAAADSNLMNVNGKYNLFWNVALDEPVTNAKRIKMIVRWQSGTGTSEIILETVRVRRQP